VGGNLLDPGSVASLRQLVGQLLVGDFIPNVLVIRDFA
jgi:hypothetical protein